MSRSKSETDDIDFSGTVQDLNTWGLRLVHVLSWSLSS